ncbi:hypothetical protein RBXJA2T_09742 [Rubrivivax benzoatilyticus JA2 = ATCC BAA-35]|nr:hypothetical protein RBXJA2T_09742 [Rubrivivax benzoatilyticus JA2 = ATCC BAA-35]
MTIDSPQPGAAGLARAAAVDAVETFGQPRQVLARDADAGVGDLDLGAAVVAGVKTQVDAAAFGRVAHGVADEVADRAEQLGLAAGDLEVLAAGGVDLVAAGRQRAAVGLGAAQQRGHR